METYDPERNQIKTRKRGCLYFRKFRQKHSKKKGYSLQQNKKALGKPLDVATNQQMMYIQAVIDKNIAIGNPVISVDTKNKVNLGNFKTNGSLYCSKGKPVLVNDHDFMDKNKGRVIPYGVYDIGLNNAFFNLGTNHDTGEFAVFSIYRWWETTGYRSYKNSKKLRILVEVIIVNFGYGNMKYSVYPII